jgi:putative transposase
VRGKFKWQEGYGAFSFSHSHIDRIVKYIIDQEKHHKMKTFGEEYIELLKKYNLEYDERFVLKNVE